MKQKGYWSLAVWLWWHLCPGTLRMEGILGDVFPYPGANLFYSKRILAEMRFSRSWMAYSGLKCNRSVPNLVKKISTDD